MFQLPLGCVRKITGVQFPVKLLQEEIQFLSSKGLKWCNLKNIERRRVTGRGDSHHRNIYVVFLTTKGDRPILSPAVKGSFLQQKKFGQGPIHVYEEAIAK